MTATQLAACLAHLEAAETLMEDAGDLAGLARLALVIDRLREEHDLPPRTIEDIRLFLGPTQSVA